MKTINENNQFSLLFKMELEDGTEVESNFDEEPIVFEIGNGGLTVGMEDALIGKKVNETVKITLTPDLAFGLPDESNIHSMPISDFPDDLPPEENQVIAFDGPDDTEIMGTIIKINNDEVDVDFSHPLSGRTIIFTAKIIEIFNP